MNTEMTKCWPWAHHWHRFKTTTARKSLDCVGESVPHYRCCHCKITITHVPAGTRGEPENTRAYTPVEETASR